MTTVNFVTKNHTAKSGVDYVKTGGTITIPPGSRGKRIDVTVLGSSVPGPDISFALVISNPLNAQLGRSLGVCTISQPGG
jgi:hypothetical protein